ncbi:MAG: HAD-IA family hydrolase [Myxococcota bacterium]
MDGVPASGMVLVLDLMSTLVREPFLEKVPEALGMTLAELIEAKHPTAWIDFEKGRIEEGEFVRRFFADGRAFDHAAMLEAMVGHYDFIDGVEALLVELGSGGHRPHIMSNYPVWYRLIEEKLRLSRYVDWTFVSCHAGLRKPDPRAYRYVAHKLGVGLHDIVFVDDRASNCEAAAGLGIDAILFEGAASLRAELVQRGFVSSGSES